MTTSKQVRVLCVSARIGLSELARRIDQINRDFNAKLKNGYSRRAQSNRKSAWEYLQTIFCIA